MTAGFWDHYPQKYWTTGEWREWRKAGSPRVPSHLQDTKRYSNKSLDQLRPLASPPPVQFIGGLYDKTRRYPRTAQSKSVDVLLKQLGIR